MSRLPRQSKFRHVFGTPRQREQCYENIQCAASTPDSQHIKCNSKYFGVPWRGGGGAILVQDHDNVGKINGIPPLICGHTSDIVDLEFSPFNDQIVVTASEDTTLKVWSIPEGGVTENITEAACTLNGHRKKLGLCLFNPVASNVLMSAAFDHTIRIWDVEKGSEMTCLEGDFADTTQGLDWNYTGSLIVTSCKDKKLRLFDPRAGTCVSTWAGHPGPKGSKAFFLGDRERIGSVGFSRQSDRQLAFHDPRALDKPLACTDIDQSSGALMPFFDVDTSILFLAGKGDANIRYFEIVDEAPYAHHLSDFRGKEAQRGCCMMPKRSLDIMGNELARLIKLNTSMVEPVSFTCPRKGDAFQDDIFPDTAAGEAAMTADEWMGGKTSGPKLVSMKPGEGVVRAQAATQGAAAVQKQSSAPAAAVDPKDAKISALETENAELKKQVAALEAKLATLSPADE
eukprot:CAMPEP_0114567488 /NCGR_PEP_ID=MMETSP0114-20121206/15508_1 /TAXON_ID=31324 /ORGANISM="Goniomonas sp, Strain m" /LENGTH=455 /DNA_ID=CAMNT_0001754081 /DNA_START=23 /DNA_END=1390 /DNA_ORIENTATION=+